ncbi:MAG: SET domain-containing protein-lysine N-methyltransferase [Chlamydiia bacterium]|nr:SET domain-containing protein-lysine N-methyltransferase [Chlamydiia bacterium]
MERTKEDAARAIKHSLKIDKGEGELLVSIQEFEALTEIQFIPQLDFAGIPIVQKIAAKCRKLHLRGQLTREQLWLGSYFKEEITSPFFPDILIRWIDSSIGWGVFANKRFKKMEFIAEYCGLVRKKKREDQKNAYCFEYVIAPGDPSSYVIDARDQGGIARFINHSNQPNLSSTLATFNGLSHVILIAKEEIPQGAQLVYDYGADYWATRSPPKNLDG